MHKTLASFLVATTIAVTLFATATDGRAVAGTIAMAAAAMPLLQHAELSAVSASLYK